MRAIAFLLFICATAFAGSLSWLHTGGSSAINTNTLANEFLFRGSSITGTTSSVTTLEDLSSNNRDASLVSGTNWTQTATDSGINNKSSVVMNASGYYRFASDGTNLIGTVNQAFYCYGVMRMATSLASPQWWLAVGWFGDSFVSTWVNSTPSYARVNFGLSNGTAPAAIGDVSGTAPATDTWFTFIVEYNGGGSATTASNWRIWINGTAQTPAALSGLGIANVRNWIGARPGGTVPVTGRIGELGLVKSTIDTTTKDGILAFWLSEYGL